MIDETNFKGDHSQILESAFPGSTEYCSTNKFSGPLLYNRRGTYYNQRDVYMRGDTLSESQFDSKALDNVSLFTQK
jgi:hypothetical protein